MPAIAYWKAAVGVASLVAVTGVSYWVTGPHQVVAHDPTSKNALSFSVSFKESVVMRIADTVRYQLDTTEGDEDYSTTLPSGGHVVYIDSGRHTTIASAAVQPEAYTLSMFHQLKCLDIVRRALFRNFTIPPSLEARHCINYLRQTMLCRMDVKMEPAIANIGEVAHEYDTVCRDWTVLYDEAERNNEAYVAWQAQQAME